MPVSYRLQDWQGNGYCDYQGYGNPYISGGENYFSCMSNQYKDAGFPTRQVLTKKGNPAMRKGQPYVVRQPPFNTFLSDPAYTQYSNICKGKKMTPAQVKQRRTTLKADKTRKLYKRKRNVMKNPMTIPQLKAILKSNGVRGYSGKNKAELLKMVQTAQSGLPRLTF